MDECGASKEKTAYRCNLLRESGTRQDLLKPQTSTLNPKPQNSTPNPKPQPSNPRPALTRAQQASCRHLPANGACVCVCDVCVRRRPRCRARSSSGARCRGRRLSCALRSLIHFSVSGAGQDGSSSRCHAHDVGDTDSVNISPADAAPEVAMH